MSTDFAQQLEHHKANSPYRFVKLDPELVADPQIGIVAAAIYSALYYKFSVLISHPESSQYEYLQKNGGWFYISQSEITQKTGLTRRQIQCALPKLIGTLVEEKKQTIKNCTRSIYRFLIQKGDVKSNIPNQGGEAPGVLPNCKGEPLGVLEEPLGVLHTRVPIGDLEINKETLLVRPTDELITKPLRQSKPGSVQSKRKLKPVQTDKEIEAVQKKVKNTSTSKETRTKNTLAKIQSDKFLQYAKEWEPKLRGAPATRYQIVMAAYAVQNVITELGYSFNDVKEVVEYAYNHTTPSDSGFCWRDHFWTLMGLMSTYNGPKKKFQKIYESLQKEKTTQRSQFTIKDYANRICPKDWDEASIKGFTEDMYWLQDTLFDINEHLSSSNKFYWHNTREFAKVMKWCLDVDLNSEMYLKSVLDTYMFYLRIKVEEGKIPTLTIWEFDNSSRWFLNCAKQKYEATGQKLVKWLKGDYE